MATLRLTKAELRKQIQRKAQLQRYLPTLQLKKALLQSEVLAAQRELELQLGRIEEQRVLVEQSQVLLGARVEFDLQAVQVQDVLVVYDNVAGVALPRLQEVRFQPRQRGLFESAPWTDALLEQAQALLMAIEMARVAAQKTKALLSELRQVTTRVNLFEKRLIPETTLAIRKIKVFLGDLELGGIAQAKVAKEKIARKQQLKVEEPCE